MRVALLLALIACSGNRSSKDGVTVELASVTLANDCGSYGAPPPPPSVMASREAPSRQAGAAAQESAASMAADQDISAAEAVPGRSRLHRGGCQQTSMQLYFRASAPASVKVKKVELLDVAGKYLQDLTPRLPTQWNGSAYVAWDEKVVGGNTQVSASYALAAPNWDRLGGRMTAQTRSYHLRVVIAVGDAEHTLEKMSITPVVIEVHPEPDVVTMR